MIAVGTQASKIPSLVLYSLLLRPHSPSLFATFRSFAFLFLLPLSSVSDTLSPLTSPFSLLVIVSLS
jgi:hypothetical protein